eukprot:4218486-Pleurochrysis_carterae.AAC.1
MRISLRSLLRRLPTLADTFAAMHKARRAAGYKLVVLGYYSKNFDPTQRRWAIFDKEAGSI